MTTRCIGNPEKKWPRSLACKQHGGAKIVANMIWRLPSVLAWVYEGDDDEERDCRACSVTVATINAWRNALQSWETPQAHRSRYVKLAERLEAVAGYAAEGKRLTKLRADLRRESKTPSLAGAAEIEQASMTEFAAIARVFAGAADDPNWTQPRPAHASAARDSLVCELTTFQRNSYGTASHAMTDAVAYALFPDVAGGGRKYVERLTRERARKPRRANSRKIAPGR